MVDKLNPLGVGQVQPTRMGEVSSKDVKPSDGGDFKQLLMNSINEVNRLQQEAQVATEKLMSGQNDNVAEVFSAVRKADIAFSLLMQIRNQLTEAYTEIRNMRI